jgi:hypothetical protein
MGMAQEGRKGGRAEGRKGGRFKDGTHAVIGALLEVDRHLGPGLMQSAYELAMC